MSSPLKRDPISAVRWFVADARDDFFPDPIQYRDVLKHASLVFPGLRSATTFRKEPTLRFGVPKGGELFQRDAVWLPPAFRIGLLSELQLVLFELGEKLHSSCYSYRPVAGSSTGSPFPNPVRQWTLFNNRFRQELLEEDGWGVVTDIASYYEAIPVDKLVETVFGLLSRSDEAKFKSVANNVRTQLNWASRSGLGIPQNNEGSSFLCTMLLSPVDSIMARSSAHYIRYVDDIRLVARSKANAINAFHVLQGQLRAMGLTLNSAKTKLIPPRSESWRQIVDAELDSLIGRVDAALDSGVPSLVSGISNDLLGRFLEASRTGKGGRDVRALGSRVLRLARYRALNSRCKMALAEVGLRGFGSDPAGSETWCRFLSVAASPEVAKELLALLSDSDANRHAWTNAWMIAVMTRSSQVSGIVMDYLRTTAHGTTRHPLERSWAIMGLGKLGTTTERRLIASEILSSDSHTQLQRSALLATQELPANERELLLRTYGRGPPMLRTLARYLRSLDRPLYDLFDARELMSEKVPPIGPSVGMIGGRLRRYTSGGAATDYD